MTRFSGFGVWVGLGHRVIRVCVVAINTAKGEQWSKNQDQHELRQA